MNKNSITIGTTTIKQDVEGRFRLNDLHKASGGENRHKPSYWYELQQTKELIAELTSEITDGGITVSEQNQPLITIKGGNTKQGTYVCKELVYNYATWISAKFNLHVIRAYDDLVSKERAELEWRAVRGDSKKNYKDMSAAVKTVHDERGEKAPFYAYTNEADLLNLIVLGMKSKHYRTINGLDDKVMIRDFMSKEQLEAYDYLENHNTCFINANMEFAERAIKLKSMFDLRFKDMLLQLEEVKQLA